MNVDQLIPILDDARLAANWLGGIGIENVDDIIADIDQALGGNVVDLLGLKSD